MVERADIVIAEASFASTGLGIELQIAENRAIPIVICYRDWGKNKADPVTYENPDHSRHLLQIGEGFVSLMALGLPTVVRAIRYSNAAELFVRLRDEIRTIART